MFVCDRLIFVCDGSGGVPTGMDIIYPAGAERDGCGWVVSGGLTVENIKRNHCDHTRTQ